MGNRAERRGAAPEGRTDRKRLAGVEGLRGIAALSILVYHVHLYGAPGGVRADLGPLTKGVDNLRAGVTLFFVLSGFLLFRPFVAAAFRNGARPSISNYLRNRAFRILPAYWVTLAFTALILEHELLTRPGQLAANASFLQRSLPSYADSDLGIVPAWSLCVEVAFYLCLPLLGLAAIWLVRRGVAAPVACLVPVGVLVAVGLGTKVARHVVSPEGAWGKVLDFSFPAHADWFAPGMAVAILLVAWEERRYRPPLRLQLGALVVSLLVALVSVKAFYAGSLDGLEYQSPIALACGVLLALVVLALPGSPLRRVLETRVVTSLGVISYGVFLIHDPLLRWLRDQDLTAAGTSGFALNLLVLVAATTALAGLMYRYVEQPALARKRQWQTSGAAGSEALGGFGSLEPSELVSGGLRRATNEAVADVAPHSDVRVEAADAPASRGMVAAIQRLVAPMVENAVRYGAEPILVRASQRDGKLLLSVEDHGRGVDSAFVPRLFEPGQRSEKSSRVPGDGMSLARARAYVRARGGELRYRPRRGGGACFEAMVTISHGPPPTVLGRITRGAFGHRPRRIGFPASSGVRGPAGNVRLLARVALLTVVAGLALLYAGDAFSASVSAPSKMAAIGDSLTRAYGAAGSAADAPAYSWSTGTNTAVSSHFLRLQASSPGITASNVAVSGVRMSAAPTQANQAVAGGAQYVTFLLGTNDVCTASTVSGMTSVASFETDFRAALVTLTGAGVRVLVASIPDWYGLWETLRSDPAATNAWALYGRCPLILGASTQAADRDSARQRLDAYRASLATICAEYSTCRYDGNAVRDLDLTTADLAFDYFHLDPSGEARVAAATWPSAEALLELGSSPPATFGASSPGSSSGTPGSGYKFGSAYPLTSAATATGFQFYARGGSAPQSFTPAIYNSNGTGPTTLVATGQTITIPANQPAGWVTTTLPTTQLTAGTYYLVLVSGPTSSRAWIYYAQGNPTSGVYNRDTPGQPTTTFGTYNTEPRLWSYRVQLSGGSQPPPQPPSNTALPVVSGTPQEGQTLTTTTGSWSGSPTSYSYQWRRCNTSGSSCTDITGATTTSYQLQTADVGTTLRSRVTATNTAGQSQPADSTQTPTITAQDNSNPDTYFGATDPGTSSGKPGSGYKFGSAYPLTTTATATGFQFYARGGSSPQSFTPAIYNSNGTGPTTLVATGQTITIPANQPAGWVTTTLPTTQLTAGTYYLVLVSGPTSSQASIYYAQTPNAGVYNHNTPGQPTTTFGTYNTEDHLLSIRVMLS